MTESGADRVGYRLATAALVAAVGVLLLGAAALISALAG